MPSFKDIIQKDIGVFLNTEEFADLHDLDGKEIPILIDEDNSSERDRQPLDLYNAANGVYVKKITIYVQLSDIDEVPAIMQHMYLDGMLHRVMDCSHSAGMVRIVLEANEA